jgi:PAS domain-containing protein
MIIPGLRVPNVLYRTQLWQTTFLPVEGRIFEASDAFLRIVGYDRDDLTSGRLRWMDLTPLEWIERDRREWVPRAQGDGNNTVFREGVLQEGRPPCADANWRGDVQREWGGLGMGLSICRSIIDAYGGRLSANPKVPRCAVFQITACLRGQRRPGCRNLAGPPERAANRCC